MFMAYEVNRKIRELFPEYVQAFLNEVNIAINKQQPIEASVILGSHPDMLTLFPTRKAFHYSEVIAFYQTLFNYWVMLRIVDQATICLELVERIRKHFELNFDTKGMNSRLSLLNLEISMERRTSEMSIRRTPKMIAKRIVEPTTEAPVFTHSIINQLYCNSLEIDRQIINDILELPRETLLADLHKVVYDSMARYETFTSMYWDIQTHEFLMHALLLLTELKDESSVEVILDVLRQDSDYFETWFGDFLTDGFWELLYAMANDKLEMLFNFVIEPNHYTYAKSCISQMTEQIVLHQPERKLEVVGWYKRVFQYWIAEKDNDDIIDTELIAFFISDSVNIQLTELVLEIKTLFDLDLVAQGISGSLDDCLEDINGISTIDRKEKIFSSITERYNDYISTWLNYGEEEERDYYEDKDTRKEIYEDLKNRVPLPGEKPKVGRNDHCPCGSGKKFKKCCGI